MRLSNSRDEVEGMSTRVCRLGGWQGRYTGESMEHGEPGRGKLAVEVARQSIVDTDEWRVGERGRKESREEKRGRREEWRGEGELRGCRVEVVVPV